MDEVERIARRFYGLSLIEDYELQEGRVETPYENLSGSYIEFFEDAAIRFIENRVKRQR